MVKSLNGQCLPGFYFVATPIGNLGDLGPRAREILAQADVVLCEDTRVTQNLYRALGLKTPKLIRYDQHTTQKQCENFVKEYEESPGIWVVTSDAGTPGVSDPGATIAAAIHAHALPIVTIPGPSSVVALLAVSGFVSTEFAFMGFFPREKKEISTKINALENSVEISTWVFFESPHRILNTLTVLNESLKRDSGWMISVGKELSKVHEHIWRGELAQVREHIETEVHSEGEKGEWVFALHKSTPPIVKEATDSNWIKALDCLLFADVPTKESATIISRQFHVPKNTVYDLALKKKSEKK